MQAKTGLIALSLITLLTTGCSSDGPEPTARATQTPDWGVVVAEGVSSDQWGAYHRVELEADSPALVFESSAYDITLVQTWSQAELTSAQNATATFLITMILDNPAVMDPDLRDEYVDESIALIAPDQQIAWKTEAATGDLDTTDATATELLEAGYVPTYPEKGPRYELLDLHLAVTPGDSLTYRWEVSFLRTWESPEGEPTEVTVTGAYLVGVKQIDGEWLVTGWANENVHPVP